MSESFGFFNEKLLADNVRIISWCPTADLVLLVSTKNTMTLCRIGVQVDKVWTLKDSTWADIKIVTWKPNGKELVIGCVDGNVYRINITYPKPKVYPCWSPVKNAASITSLVWINYEYKKTQTDIEGFDIDAFDLESSLPTLSEQPPEEPVSRIPVSRRKKIQLPIKPFNSTETQTLLFIGNAKGQIHISLNGVYPIGFIDMYEEEEEWHPMIFDISVPENVASVQVMTTSMDENKKGLFRLHFINTSILQDKKDQIFSISEIQNKLDYLLEYITITLDVLVRHHTSYALLTSKMASEASDYISRDNHQATAMPEVELTGTLAIGSVTESLRLFFEEYLTSQYLKQLESNVTHGYQNSLKIVCEHILPACERIQLELSKLLGFSLWTQRYGDFLEIKAVENSIECIREFVTQIHLFTKDLNRLATTFKAFIKWITMVTEKVTSGPNTEFQNESSLCEDPELVLEFLNHDFIKDSLAEYFVLPTQDVNKKQFVYLLNEIKTSCNKMLEKPSITFSEQMKVTANNFFRLDGVSLCDQPRDTVISFNTTKQHDGYQYNYYAFLQLNLNPKLVILKNGFGKDSKIQQALFNMPEGIITDMEFFDENELGICIQDDKNDSTLSTLLLNDIEFKTISDTKDLKVNRSLKLENMIHVKLGCNGSPKRRIMCVVASNGLLKVYSMDNDDDDDDDDDDEAEQDDDSEEE